MSDAPGRTVRTHGYGGYTHGCRCDDCKKGNADYKARRRAAATLRPSVKPVEDITHGRYGYEERGCRCDVCVEARQRGQGRTPKRRRKTVLYLSAGQMAAELGISLNLMLTCRKRYPDFPAPDIRVGPGGKGSTDGWSASRVPELRAWFETRPGRGAPGRGKSLAHRQAMKAGHARRRAALAAAAEADTAQG